MILVRNVFHIQYLRCNRTQLSKLCQICIGIYTQDELAIVNIIQLFGEDRAMQLNRVPVLRLCHGNVLDVRQKILLKLCKFRVALFLLTLLFLYRFLLNLLAKYGLPFFSEV